MHLLAKATKFLHKPLATVAHSKPPSTATPIASPRAAPGLKICRRGRDLSSLRTPPPAPTLYLGDIGSDVHRCLQQIKGLEFGNYGTIVALTRLGEDALDPVAEAIRILVRKGQLRAACTLIEMFKPEWRPALLNGCSAEVKVLRACQVPDVRKAMDRALLSAGRHALCSQDILRFLNLLPYCSPETAASLELLLPPLTIEMVQALDESMLVKAVDVTVGRIMKLSHPEACLAELDALLSIANKLHGRDLPRAVVMKCIVWERLGTDGIPDPVVVGKLRQLQYKALLPAVTPALLDRLPAEFKRAVSIVLKEQGAMSQHLEGGFDPLPLKTLLLQESSEPGHFAEVLLDKLGFPAGADPISQMIQALPMLCADHPFALDFILRTEQGKDLVAQAMMTGLLKQRYNPGTVVSLIMALADRIDLQAVVSKEIGQDKWASQLKASAMMTLVIDLLTSGVPHAAEAADKILSLTEGSEAARERLRAQMRDLLPTLCDREHAIERAFILKTEQGQRLVAQAVMDYLSQPELDGAVVASFFETLADGVDLRTADMFSVDPSVLSNLRTTIPVAQRWGARFKRLGRVELGGEEGLRRCTEKLAQWKPGWRLLLLPVVDSHFFTDNLGLGYHGILSAQAIDAAAADSDRGGANEKMNLLRKGVPKALELMLNVSVADTPLLSDEALRNVMRAVVSDPALAESVLMWTNNFCAWPDVRQRMYAAMADALVEFRNEHSPSRFDEVQVPMADVPSQLVERARQNQQPQNREFRNPEWWEALASRGLLDDLAPDSRIQ